MKLLGFSCWLCGGDCLAYGFGWCEFVMPKEMEERSGTVVVMWRIGRVRWIWRMERERVLRFSGGF